MGESLGKRERGRGRECGRMRECGRERGGKERESAGERERMRERTENVGTDLDLSLIVFLKDAC